MDFWIRPILVEVPEGVEIQAGTMIVVERTSDENAVDAHIMPEGTILMAGQRLSREMYPELGGFFTETGGFYEFQLPDLENKFLLGFGEDNSLIMGSGAVYYQTMPHVDDPNEAIRRLNAGNRDVSRSD
jgi:hypothetical protein